MKINRRLVPALALATFLGSCSGNTNNDDAGPATSTTNALTEQVDRIVADAAKLPRAEFDPAALAKALGRDPQAIFEWVRDKTCWAPYRGLLRGPQGVMLDRLGSSLDRATLLGDLLRRAGYAVRLAHADLPASRATELLGKVRTMPSSRAVTTAPANYDKQFEKQIADSQRAAAQARALIQSQTDAVLTAARDLVNANRSGEAASVEALRDHWWVERQDGDKWIAMDVLLPDMKPGEAVATASLISAWDPKQSFPAIPDSDWHVVDLHVVVEKWDAGATREFAVLETSLRPAEILGQPVTLSHLPAPWPSDFRNADANPKLFRDAAIAVKLWVPTLRVGDKQITQSSFTSRGDLQRNLPKSEADVARTAGDVASGMDMALGGFSPDVAPPAVTAEWIDYEIKVPGAPPQRLRRPVFDILGPARRAAQSSQFNGAEELRKLERFEALWARTEILLQPCDFTGAYVTHLDSASIVANQEALKNLARETDPARKKAMAPDILERFDLWTTLPTLALWRSDAGISAGDAFIDRPNVLHYRAGRRVIDGSTGGFNFLIDVGSNGVGSRPGATAAAFQVRVQQGIVDTVAEMLAIGNDLDKAQNTASVFARLARENSRGTFIAARDEAAVRQLPWPEDELARVMADVKQGYAVVVPKRAVDIEGQPHVGWWRINPQTGETIGVMDSGFNQAQLEKLKLALIALAPFLADPQFMQRMQNVQSFVNHYGTRAVPQTLLFRLQLYNIARALEADLSFLAKTAGS